MIGRLTRENTLAEVGVRKVAKVLAAGGLILAAFWLEYLSEAKSRYVLLLCLASLSLTGFPVIFGAARGLARFKTNVDELVSLAIIASLILGEWISAAVVAFIMVLGGLLEEFTSARARRQIEQLALSSPEYALRIRDDGESESIPVSELRAGMLILARPGDVLPIDGIVVEGESDVDESMLTGEALPSPKEPGDVVSAGTVNGEGALRIRVERVGNDTTQGKIIHLIAEADHHRAPILRVAEAYAKWFTPAVLLLAAAVFGITQDPFRAVTMLIVGCPCAFVLATPTAVIAALGRASKSGVLIKGGKYLEACAKVDTLAFDKTGTLTSGHSRVAQVFSVNGLDPREVLWHAARLESTAEHPLARAVVAEAKRQGLDVPGHVSIRRESGLGLSEISDSQGAEVWRIGNERFMKRHRVDMSPEAQRMVEPLRAAGLSALFLSQGQVVRGVLAVEDEIRPETSETLERLRADGYGELHMLTGDADSVAHSVARRLRLPETCVAAELLPDDKYRHIDALQKQGRCVCYVGDGTNDGPALAVASVGMSIGSRENTVALETAQVVLMSGGLGPLPFLLRLAKRTRRTINQNILIFGLAFNAVMLGLSATGVLTPILGAIGHNVGSVAVVLNSARLLGFKAD